MHPCLLRSNLSQHFSVRRIDHDHQSIAAPDKEALVLDVNRKSGLILSWLDGPCGNQSMTSRVNDSDSVLVLKVHIHSSALGIYHGRLRGSSERKCVDTAPLLASNTVANRRPCQRRTRCDERDRKRPCRDPSPP